MLKNTRESDQWHSKTLRRVESLKDIIRKTLFKLQNYIGAQNLSVN